MLYLQCTAVVLNSTYSRTLNSSIENAALKSKYVDFGPELLPPVSKWKVEKFLEHEWGKNFANQCQ